MSVHICDACGKPIPDDAAVCPHCGAEQEEDIRLTRIPETIDELRAFCEAHRMPLERMRFFIGEDYRGARAAYTPPTARGRAGEVLSFLWKPVAIVSVIGLALAMTLRWAWSQPDRGYYRYRDNTYYYQNLDWYRYNDASGSWEEADDMPETLKDNYGDYFQSAEYDADYGAEAFTYGSVYGDDFTSYSESVDYDYDSDYDSGSSYDDYDWDDYDYDSWDSDDTDWDSDW